MQSLADFIVDFLKINEGINFKNVALIIVVYILSVWFVICIWVFFDAKKRYDNIVTAVLFATLVFILNFPILIFYLVIRPDITFDDFDDWEAGGVNVPIVNFMGKQGIEMSFELRINPKKLRDTDKSPDMNIEIGWDKQDERFRLIDREELARQIIGQNIEEKQQRPLSKQRKGIRITNYFNTVSGRVKRSVGEVGIKVGGFRNKIKNRISAPQKSKVNAKQQEKIADTQLPYLKEAERFDSKNVSDRNRKNKKKKRRR